MIHSSSPRISAPVAPLPKWVIVATAILMTLLPKRAETLLGQEAATAQAEAEEAKKEELPENPLGRLLEGLLRKPQGRLIPKASTPDMPANDSASSEESAATEEAPAASVRNFRDWVDRCAPHDYALEKMLDKVQRNLELKAWKIALEQLQQVLDQPNHRISLGPGRSRLSRDEIHRIISTLPKDARQSYELQFGVVAEQAFKAAKQQGQLTGIADVASRYLNTKAGMEAADYLAGAHLDRGEWIASALWYQRVLSIDPKPDRPAFWFLKAAIAFEHAGLDSLSERMLGELKGLESIQIADRPASPMDVVSKMNAIPQSSPLRVSEWPQFRAVSSRSAVQSGGIPILVPQWEMSSTNSISVQNQVRELTNDLRRAGETILPVVQPTVIGNRFFVRTMNGVMVVEWDSERETDRFRQVWQTRQENTPEQLVTGLVNSKESLFSVGRENREISLINDYSGSNPEVHPLTGLLYRNGMYGMVSADRKRLYVPERHAWLSRYQPGYFSTRSNVESRDPLKREWSSNSLSAYDLETGRLTWEIGGRSFGEDFKFPLAGYYFFGPPLVVNDSLYVVGERDNQIRLICLEDGTGHPRWSTPIGFSLHEPAVDLGRRWWTAQPALSDGIMVVPNTTGWLLGVDLTTHAVIWETRFTKPSRNQNSGSQRTKEGIVESQSLDGQWHLSAPVIVGNRVYHTPRESDKLMCLRLVDGDVIWEIPKGDLVSLLHADNQQLIFATTYGLQCYDAVEEKVLWEYRSKQEKVTLSGLPAITETDIYAPWSDASLTQISRADGKLIERSVQPPEAEPLGNLRFADNYLISASPLRTVVFELKSSFDQKLASRLAADPNDSWGLLQKAQLSQLEGDPKKTLELVSSLDREALSAHDRQKQNELIYHSLVSLIRSDLNNSAKFLERLQSMELNRERRREVIQLELDRMVSLGHYQEAFERYLNFSEQNEIGSLVPERPESRYRLQYAILLKRGLKRILEKCPSDVRTTLHQKIESMVETVNLDDQSAVRRLLLLFPEHPAIETLRFKLARRAVEQSELSIAEYHYRSLLNSPIPTHVADAAFELDELYQQFERHSARRQLRGQMRDIFNRENSSSSGLPNSSQTDMTQTSLTDLADWGDFSLDMHQGALSYQVMNQYRYRMIGDPLPMLPDIRYDYNSSSERLQIHSTTDPDDLWSVPLRNSGSISSRKRGLVRSLGHVMFVIQSNNVTAISPLERRVLWNRSLQSNLKFVNQRSYSSYGSSIPGLVTGSQFNQEYSAVNRQQKDPVIALTPDLICVRSQRELQAFHPLTGELLWTIEKISSGSQIISNGNLLYILNPSTEELSWKVYLSEGRRVPLDDDQRDRLQNAIALVGGDVVTMESSTYRTLFLQSRTVVKVRRVNLESGEPVWEWENNGETLMGMTRDGIVILDRKNQALSKIDLETGEERMLVSLIGRLPKIITESYVVESNDRLYLIANGERESSFYRNYYLDSVPVNGDVIAIDPRESSVLWSKPVRHQHMLLELVEDSPMLLFLARKSTRIGNISRTSQSILALDQRNGHELLEYESPYRSDFQTVHLNHEDQKISLMSYNSRVVLSAIPPLTDPLTAPKPQQNSTEKTSAVSSGP